MASGAKTTMSSVQHDGTEIALTGMAGRFPGAGSLDGFWQPDWQALHAGKRRRVPLPTYPFLGKRYWLDAPGAPLSALEEASVSP
jgi:acyl transferase domain-containing protein